MIVFSEWNKPSHHKQVNIYSYNIEHVQGFPLVALVSYKRLCSIILYNSFRTVKGWTSIMHDLINSLGLSGDGMSELSDYLSRDE